MTVKNFQAELWPKVEEKGLDIFFQFGDFLLFVVFKDLKFHFCYVVEAKKKKKILLFKEYLSN